MTNGFDDITNGDPRLEALFSALAGPDEIDDEIAARQVAEAAAAVGETHAAPVLPTPLPWYRRVVVRLAGLGLAAKMLLGAAVAVAATGGAAAGGVLPDPIQSFVADGASRIGVELPNPRLATSTTSTTTSTSTVAGDAGAPSTTLGDDDETTTDTTPGSYSWDTTTCAGESVSIRYTVTDDGELDLDAVIGEADIESTNDRIRVEFDGVDIEIRLRDDAVTIDEDRECTDGAESNDSTTTTSEPVDDVTTTTQAGSEAGEHPEAGTHMWSSTSCSGAPLAVEYTIDGDGDISLGSITGDVIDVDESLDRIRIAFSDGVDVDIRVSDDSLVVDEDRECASESDDASGTTSTTIDD